VETVCGLAPEAYRDRVPYQKLAAIAPTERFRVAECGQISMRIVDLVAPIAKGTRGLIVSPPKAGKTTILEHLALGIRASDPDARIIALLVDERPEEVTHFRRTVDAEVFSSSNDQSVTDHVELTEMTLAHARAELECGRDVVILVDSLTRMGRAFNVKGVTGTGRTMTGGLDAGALEIPRSFFGLARNVENGGSVTILATVLVDTGSRMDEVIFQEFKGTGNCEIVLDRELAEHRLYPAVHLNESGTRREDLLYTPEEVAKISSLRRALASLKPIESLGTLLKLMERHDTNEKLLASLPG
jgi:transcription termination factor Rho